MPGDCLSGNIASDGPVAPVTAANTRKTDYASGCDSLYGVGYNRSGASAFDDDIRLEPDTRDTTGMVLSVLARQAGNDLLRVRPRTSVIWA